MAKRRMFSRDVIDTDHFLEMPMTAQVLYFHLALRADDDGFVASPKRIMRLIGVGEDDMKILVAKSFIIPFETGICVIRHWKIHNYIQKDRYSPTTYQEEFNMLKENTNRTYDLDTECIQSGYILDTQDRLGKDRLGKDRLDIGGNGKDNSVQMYDKCTPEIERELEIDKEIKKDLSAPKKRFQKPTIEEVTAYCKERGKGVDPHRFFDYYEANGWMVGRNKMKDWKSAVRYWERNTQADGKHKGSKEGYSLDISAYRTI